jgi:hypothetical protein
LRKNRNSDLVQARRLYPSICVEAVIHRIVVSPSRKKRMTLIENYDDSAEGEVFLSLKVLMK